MPISMEMGVCCPFHNSHAPWSPGRSMKLSLHTIVYNACACKSLNSANHTFNNTRFMTLPALLMVSWSTSTPCCGDTNAWHSCVPSGVLSLPRFPLYVGNFSSGTSNLSASCTTAQPNTESEGSHGWVHNRAEAGGNKELVVRDKERWCSTRRLLGPLYCYFLAFLMHVMYDTSIFSTFVLSGIELRCQSSLFCS